MQRRASGAGADEDGGLILAAHTAEEVDSKTKTNNEHEDHEPADSEHPDNRDEPAETETETETTATATATGSGTGTGVAGDKMEDYYRKQRQGARLRSPWACSLATMVCTALSLLLLGTIAQSFLSRQLDPKGCAMCYMRAAFAKFTDFDTEHTRFATKYSLYLYREGGIDEDTHVKGVPVLFIPGNAGSYKQVRPIAAEAAYYFHDVVQHDQALMAAGKRPLDFFSVDFNEDITAFHGQTLLDQAEYLNEAIAYILQLYTNPNRSLRDPTLPDPTSVMIVGHSMGGIVARTMLTMPNYQANTINTILTLSAPHARAPVSFDQDIVQTYHNINQYWRDSYSHHPNPLDHVTLVSIAGGGLDTVVPSDYSSLTSLVPESHGFTVFTSTIPNVWTGMDHLAIMWCDQFRKAVVRALYDVADVRQASQTVSRPERMRFFRKRFLTGMEPMVEKTLPQTDAKMLLTLPDTPSPVLAPGQRLTLAALGTSFKTEAHVLPIPSPVENESRKLSLLTNQNIDRQGPVHVFLCTRHSHQPGAAANLFPMDLDLSAGSSASTRLACKDAAVDVIALPASTPDSNFAFDNAAPFSYLEYALEDIADYQFVAVIDRATEPTDGWVIAEFTNTTVSSIKVQKTLRSMLVGGLHHVFPASRAMVNELHIPRVHSSLLAYSLQITQNCKSSSQLFRPLLRQYILEPYESKFFPNVQDANINLHGVSPYVPPPLHAAKTKHGLNLQIWSDPTCDADMEVRLNLDMLGSAGKLYMRYRTVFAAFPLVVVALVLRKQFNVYDATGIFMSFSEGMDQCIRSSLPVLFVALSILSLFLSKQPSSGIGEEVLGRQHNSTESFLDFTKNDLLLGSNDPFFCFLIPMFGLISVGVCIVVNYVTLALTQVSTSVYARIRYVSLRNDEGRRTATAFAVTSPVQRIVTTSVLLLMVATIIPYQFAYLVLCLVQLATSVRALRLAQETRSGNNYNFYNYAHSLLLLMLWVLPINLPVLVVWIHNLAVHWLTPFSSHHNILSIMPYVFVVETMSTGHMIPRLAGRLNLATNVLLFALAIYAAVYGVTYAYVLHHLVNGLCAWLALIHFAPLSSKSTKSPSSKHTATSSWGGSWVAGTSEDQNQGHTKKRP